MGVLTFILSLVIPINSSMNCFVDVQKTIDDTYLNSVSHISQLTSLIQNNSSAIAPCASITIFNHGMGGDGKDWYTIDTNNGNHDEFGGLFLSPLSDAQSISLKNTTPYIFNQSSQILLSKLYNPSSQNALIDFSKPLFLVYQGPYDSSYEYYLSNEALYFHFAQAVDAFLYAYYNSFGVIPKINLIGHSRGGLINMIYAINHPQLIASFMSVGTPYLGSEWAEVLYYLQEALVETVPSLTCEHTPYYSVIGDAFANAYAEDWNEIVDEYNFPTKIVGCGYSEDLFGSMIEDVVEALLGSWIDSFSSFGLQFFVNVAATAIQNLVSFLIDVLIDRISLVSDLIADGVLNQIILALEIANFFNYNAATDLVIDALNQVAYVLDEDVFIPLYADDDVTSDFAVNLNSQVGKTRNGTQVFDFDTVELFFDAEDILASSLSRPADFPALHNYEAKSPLVKSQFTSLIQANPSCRHVHSFSASNGSSGHSFSCACGATFHTCQGLYSYSNYNVSQHLKECSLCGYSRLMPHSYDYTSYNTNGHSGVCDECGRLLVNGAHEFVYTASLNNHVGMCPCGYSVIEPHTYIGGKCIKCNRRKPGFGF